MSEKQNVALHAVTTWSSWRALIKALQGDALATFPQEAFEADVVVHRVFGHRQFIFNRPQAIRRVLVENPGNYVRTAPTIRVLSPIFGCGLFLSTGQEWRRQRRTVAPAFAPRAIGILARHVAAAADSLITELTAVRTRPIHLVPVLRQLALESIGSAMFSLQMKRYGAAMRQLILDYAERLGRPTLLDFLLPLAIPTPCDLRRRGFRRRWFDLVGQIIGERLRKTDDRRQLDLFDLLVTSHPPGQARAEQLADEVATIVVAGHETTASALFWSLYLMASIPAEQEAVAAEVASVDVHPDSAVDALSKLVRTRAAVYEALRLYPPAFVIARQALADDVVDNIRVPAGSLVLIAPWILHRHHRSWNVPEVFDPTRFLPGAPAPEHFTYLPFGAGPRVCIGAQFALAELTLLLAIMIHTFTFRLAEPLIVRPIGIVSTQPENPPPFLLHRR